MRVVYRMRFAQPRVTFDPQQKVTQWHVLEAVDCSRQARGEDERPQEKACGTHQRLEDSSRRFGKRSERIENFSRLFIVCDCTGGGIVGEGQRETRRGFSGGPEEELCHGPGSQHCMGYYAPQQFS